MRSFYTWADERPGAGHCHARGLSVEKEGCVRTGAQVVYSAQTLFVRYKTRPPRPQLDLLLPYHGFISRVVERTLDVENVTLALDALPTSR